MKNFIIVLICLSVLNTSLFCFADEVKQYKVCDVLGSRNRTFIIKSDTGYGLLEEKDNKITLEPVFSKISKADKYHGFLIVEKIDEKNKKTYGMYHWSGEQIAAPIYDSVELKPLDTYVIKDNKKGVFDYTGKEIFPLTECDELKRIDINNFFYKQKNKNYVYDIKNKKSIQIPFDNIVNDKTDFIVEQNGKKGIWNVLKKDLVIPVEYDDIYNLHWTYFKLKKDEKYGFYDSEKDILLKPQYRDIEYLYVDTYYSSKRNWAFFLLKEQDNLYTIAFVSKNNALKSISYKIEEVSDKHLRFQLFDKIYIPCKKDGKYGIIDINSETEDVNCFLPFEYDDICANYRNSKWFYFTKKNGKFDIIDIDKMKHLTDFDDVDHLYNRIFKVKKNGKYAICDLYENKISRFLYDDVKYEQDILYVKIDGKWKQEKSEIAKNAGEMMFGIIFPATLPVGVAISIPVMVLVKSLSEEQKVKPIPKEVEFIEK